MPYASVPMQIGAFMNETFQAREGLPPSLFPASVPTYMGHYHKPHIVSDTSIRYVGSPYQGTVFETLTSYLPSCPHALWLRLAWLLNAVKTTLDE